MERRRHEGASFLRPGWSRETVRRWFPTIPQKGLHQPRLEPAMLAFRFGNPGFQNGEHTHFHSVSFTILSRASEQTEGDSGKGEVECCSDKHLKIASTTREGCSGLEVHTGHLGAKGHSQTKIESMSLGTGERRSSL